MTSPLVMPETMQDMVELMIVEIRKMSEEEKFVFRCGIRKAFKMKTPKIGDNSVSGKKFQVSSGDITVKVEEGQIILK